MNSILPQITMDPGWLYIAWERQFIESNIDIFKIGKTIDVESLKPRYPKQTKFLFTCYTNHIKTIEDEVKSKFPFIFTPRTDYGTEYFRGDFKSMRSEMVKIIDLHDDCIIASSDITIPPIKTLYHFCNEVLEKTNNYGKGVTLDDLHHMYIRWLPKNMVDIPYINRKEFRDKISKILGKPAEKSGKLVYYGRNLTTRYINKIPTKYQKDADVLEKFVNENLVKDVGNRLEWIKIKNRLFDWLTNKDRKTQHSVKSKTVPDIQKCLSSYLGDFVNTTSKDHLHFRGFNDWELTNTKIRNKSV